MPITATCRACKYAFKVKDELAGKRVKCPKCKGIVAIPEPVEEIEELEDEPEEVKKPAKKAVVARSEERREKQPAGDPILDADRFRYSGMGLLSWDSQIMDDDGETLFFISRPGAGARNLGAGCLATFLFLIILGVFVTVGVMLALGKNEALAAVVIIIGLVIGIILPVVIYYKLAKKASILLYNDEDKEDVYLELVQESSRQYTVKDVRGEAIGQFKGGILQGVFYYNWTCYDADGKKLFKMTESPLLMAILRRALRFIPYAEYGSGFVKTHFWFTTVKGKKLGDFKKPKKGDGKYLLDLSDDEDKRIDRQLALAAGAILELGMKK